MERRHSNWLALSGVVSPILLTVTTLAVAGGRSDYSHTRQTLSELGAIGRRGAVAMNLLGIVPAGALVSISAVPLYQGFGRGRLGAAGAIALATGGACLAGTALSPWRGGFAPDLRIAANATHLLLAIVGFFMLSVSTAFFGMQARHARGAEGWAVPSLAAAAGILLLAFWPNPGAYAGAFQRGALIVFFGWLAAASLWVWQSSRR